MDLAEGQGGNDADQSTHRSARKTVAPEQNRGALKGRCKKAPKIETAAPEHNTA